MPLFGLESSRLLSPDLGSNGPFLKGLKCKNRWFRPATARPSRGGSSNRQFCIFCGGLSQLCGGAPGSFRTGAGAHCVAPVVATNWCEGPHGSVTQWRILSAPTCVFIGLFSIAESYLVDPASNHMLVSEINPCMSKFTLFHGETANGSLNHS